MRNRYGVGGRSCGDVTINDIRSPIPPTRPISTIESTPLHFFTLHMCETSAFVEIIQLCSLVKKEKRGVNIASTRSIRAPGLKRIWYYWRCLYGEFNLQEKTRFFQDIVRVCKSVTQISKFNLETRICRANAHNFDVLTKHHEVL